MIKHVKTKEEFNDIVNTQTVLVDFFATWCGPCRMLGPVLEEIDNENLLGIDIIKVDVDENPLPANALGIQSIPTLVIYKDGKVVNMMVGYQSKDSVVSWVKKSIE